MDWVWLEKFLRINTMSAKGKQPYHDYVFDIEQRKFVGKFEEMYQQEDVQGFDSWYQEDTTHITKRLSLCLLEQYNFDSVLDVGCGKGSFTHLLKKNNNEVSGCDLSETAIKKAKSRFPSINFFTASSSDLQRDHRKQYDLVILMEVLSYIADWQDFISYISTITHYCLISLYLPPNPIGFIKSFDVLTTEAKKYFDIEKELVADKSLLIVMLKKKS
jgi:SAM-dependent methyltransferase